MLAEIMDIKDIYTVGDNLREIIGQDLSVFTGQNLVDWLLKNDRQVESRDEGLKLGRYLVEYRVIHHVEDKYHFLDDPNKSYRFCKDTEVCPRKDTERHTWVQGLTVMRHFAQEVSTAKKRRKSWKPFLNKGGPNSNNFKGKHLMDWLEKNSDFESRDECRRFFKSLLKLNFIRSSQNELKFCENTEYWFYVTRLKEDGSKMRRLSRTLLPERKPSVDHQGMSPTGLTVGLMSVLAAHEAAGTEDRSGRLSLRRTCSVLRSSLSRSSFGASSNSLARSNSSGSESRSRVVMRSVVNRGLEEERRTVHLSSFSSRDSLDCNVTLQERSARSSTSDEGTRPRADDFCLRQLRAQLAMQRTRSSHSESSSGSVSDLIESPDFQKILHDIGKSSSQKNIKQLEEGRRAILCQLEARKYGKPSPISPSSSCPQDLGSVIKRNMLLSGRFGSISDQSISSSEDDVIRSRDVTTSRDSVCSTPIALSQFEYPEEEEEEHSGMSDAESTCSLDSLRYHHDSLSPDEGYEVTPKLSGDNSTKHNSPADGLPDAETLKVLMSRAVCHVTATSTRRTRLQRTRRLSMSKYE